MPWPPWCAPNPFAEEREDRTLLSHEQMRAIISVAPGERAMHHLHVAVHSHPYHLGSSVRGLSQTGRERRQLRLRADPRSLPCVHQARRRREAAQAETHDPFSVVPEKGRVDTACRVRPWQQLLRLQRGSRRRRPFDPSADLRAGRLRASGWRWWRRRRPRRSGERPPSAHDRRGDHPAGAEEDGARNQRLPLWRVPSDPDRGRDPVPARSRASERSGWRDPAGEEVMRGLDVHPVDSHNHDHDCGQYS